MRCAVEPKLPLLATCCSNPKRFVTDTTSTLATLPVSTCLLRCSDLHWRSVVLYAVEGCGGSTDGSVAENCPRRFDTQGGLKNHASRCNERVERRKFHTCEICSMEFLCPQTLEAHMNKHNGIKPYKCKNESCGKHFYGKGELYRHNMLCGKDKPICPLCGVQLSSKGTLKAHMETHAEEPVAGCDTCGKKFKSSKSLKRHQAVHSDERNYPCGVCGKALKSANALYVHRRIHTQEKPYSCTVCGQRFAYKCLVKPHVKKCHAEEG